MDSRPRKNGDRAGSDARRPFSPERGMDGPAQSHPWRAATCCDRCAVDWRERREGGGLLFDGKAICPECAPALWDAVRAAGAECLVEDFTHGGESFAEACARWTPRMRAAAARRSPVALCIVTS